MISLASTGKRYHDLAAGVRARAAGGSSGDEISCPAQPAAARRADVAGRGSPGDALGRPGDDDLPGDAR